MLELTHDSSAYCLCVGYGFELKAVFEAFDTVIIGCRANCYDKFVICTGQVCLLDVVGMS
jgi:hypothetical protein